MVLTFKDRKYSPAEVARYLSEEYGYKLTAAAIRKWDNLIVSCFMGKAVGEAKRDKGESRAYDERDLMFFSAIAILRNLDYSLQDVKFILSDRVIKGAKLDPAVYSEVINTDKDFILEIKRQIELHNKGFEKIEKILSTIKKG